MEVEDFNATMRGVEGFGSTDI
ncbi:hypothetical protein NC652_033996 [Populus alba x Populus x berolinensis]|uniref:Uncharacterized protein n=1 Tax=Populus alba x Populus x berolinensis TaxID=444605 RepID=A0AAD6Q1G0_9ROSI|nr:hypothetical protein NC652_033996 [Populus alba x Populus x berolinensis]KAJ6973703.1 hypothetical protein NC653_033902 [Populus alba x Populus x berolinensis]